jgi:hypothetical protein
MNFKSKGLFIAILILIAMLAICHISNYIYLKQYKNKNKNKINNSFSNLPLDTKYNEITYEKPIDPSICKNVNEAEIPCSIISSCSTASKNTVPITTGYELSESEWAVVYKAAYEAAGIEVLSRTLSELNPTTTNPNPVTTKQTGRYWP